MNDVPLKVAVVGAGPGGFYAAESLLRSDVAVDMYEKLPVPFGLVRFGVAPDHPKLKSVTAVFARIAEMDGFRFFGNVELGRDVSIAELDAHYHAIIFAYGAERGNTLGIPGENLQGSFTAHEFVAWYNGHPDFKELAVDLSCRAALIIGQGNVALDVARILAKPVDELRQTDIADHALDALAESAIRDIYIAGRRGPVQVQFVGKELREFAALTDCPSCVDMADLALGSVCQDELVHPSRKDAKACVDLLRTFADAGCAEDQAAKRRCHFLFNRTPLALRGQNRVQTVTLGHTALQGEMLKQHAVETSETSELECGLVVSSIGYKTVGIDGLPLADRGDRLHHEDGRIVNGADRGAAHYVAGWAKRGPQGTIGTNRGDSVATVETLLADRASFTEPKEPRTHLLSILANRGTEIVSFEHWRKIDACEVVRGATNGRPRNKLTSVAEMMANAGIEHHQTAGAS